MTRVCAGFDCTNELADGINADLCFKCIAAEQRLVNIEIPHKLELEAAFVEWCREHGHPNPHE